jgi:type I restriction enzyme, S subunit
MKALSFRDGLLSSTFFMRWVQGLNNQLLLAWGKQGATVESLEHEYLANTRIAWPDGAEKAAIITFLDRETAKIDGLIAEQHRLIELLKEKRQAVISHAVTRGLDPDAPMKPSGVEWLGDVPAHWEVLPIKRVAGRIEQGWSPQCENYPAEGEDEWGVLKVGCVNGGEFRPEENKRLPAELEPLPELGIRSGDLLISRANTRDLVGSAAVARKDYPRLMLCDKLYRLRMERERCLPAYMALYLNTAAARNQIELGATGASSSMLNIGQGTILEMQMPVPPVRAQREIVEFVEGSSRATAELREEAANAIALLKERRSALISAAVTGKIDVRGIAMAEAA